MGYYVVHSLNYLRRAGHFMRCKEQDICKPTLTVEDGKMLITTGGLAGREKLGAQVNTQRNKPTPGGIGVRFIKCPPLLSLTHAPKYAVKMKR